MSYKQPYYWQFLMHPDETAELPRIILVQARDSETAVRRARLAFPGRTFTAQGATLIEHVVTVQPSPEIVVVN